MGGTEIVSGGSDKVRKLPFPFNQQDSHGSVHPLLILRPCHAMPRPDIWSCGYRTCSATPSTSSL
eukprot:207351-Rhodomonas_salina.2